MTDIICKTCEGSGKIANDGEKTPWSFYEKLPIESAGGVLMGFIKPTPCPDCGGSGKEKS